MHKITFALDVNGTEYTVRVEPRKLLSDVLREDCALTGTHRGLRARSVRACTVQVDGSPCAPA